MPYVACRVACDAAAAHACTGSAFHKFVNANAVRTPEASNVLTLFVSATPYNLQTSKSQVPIANEVDMVREDQSSPIVYYGLDRYVARTRHVISGASNAVQQPQLGGYLAADEAFEIRAAALQLEFAKDHAAFPPGNKATPNSLRLRARGSALIEEYGYALAEAAGVLPTDASCSEYTRRMVHGASQLQRRDMRCL